MALPSAYYLRALRVLKYLHTLVVRFVLPALKKLRFVLPALKKFSGHPLWASAAFKMVRFLAALGFVSWLLTRKDSNRQRQQDRTQYRKREGKKPTLDWPIKIQKQFDSQEEQPASIQSPSEDSRLVLRKDGPSIEDLHRISLIKGNTKYCTDVETDPFTGSTQKTKEDCIFFDMLSLYREAGRKIEEDENESYLGLEM